MVTSAVSHDSDLVAVPGVAGDVKSVDIGEGPAVSVACSLVTWTFLSFIMSMCVLSWKLHHHSGPWKESASASAKYAETRLTNWADGM